MSDHSFPTSIDSLILPSAAHNFSQTLSSLKRSRLSLKNRLASIYEDSQFVQHVSELYSLPLVANERCGSWYIPTEKKTGSAYFKSTDGHQGQWKFSLRRLNLQVLEIVGKNSGCIVVDSTRSGKSMPDALSKTVPIWCSVINRLLFPEDAESHVLQTPLEVVGRSEHTQIEERLAGFLENAKGLQLDIAALRACIDKSLRPLWVTRSSMHSLSASFCTTESKHLPVVCCTASRQESDILGDSYIQGAGDDSEGWAKGLTPEIFWQNRSSLLSLALEDVRDVPKLLQKLELDRANSASFSNIVAVYPAQAEWPIYICSLADLAHSPPEDIDGIITCDEQIITSPSETLKVASKSSRLCLDSKTGKYGSRNLRDQLPRLEPFIKGLVSREEHPRLLFACKTGRDLSVGVALTVLCLHFDSNGIFQFQRTKESTTKDFIRRRLSWIMAAKPDANPARATLQSVNSFLMERPQ